MRVFLSYRRADVGGHAGRLADRLEQRLGTKNVFHDVTGIGPGKDFDAEIREALEACDVALAVIGPGWLVASTAGGQPRLFEPNDYVRLELSSVLARDLPVIPVLVGGAPLPTANDLPAELRPLLQRQAVLLRDETWQQDVEYLLRSLRGERGVAPPPSRRRIGVTMAVAFLVAVSTILFWRPWAEREDGPDGAADDGVSTSTLSPSCPDPAGPSWTKLTLNPNPTARQQFDDGFLLFTVRAASSRPLEEGRWQIVIDTNVANHRTSSNFGHEGQRYEALIVGKEFTASCFESSPEGLTPGTAGDARIGWVVSCEPIGRVDLVLYLGTRLRVAEGAEPSPC